MIKNTSTLRSESRQLDFQSHHLEFDVPSHNDTKVEDAHPAGDAQTGATDQSFD